MTLDGSQRHRKKNSVDMVTQYQARYTPVHKSVLWHQQHIMRLKLISILNATLRRQQKIINFDNIRHIATCFGHITVILRPTISKIQKCIHIKTVQNYRSIYTLLHQ